MFLLMQRKSCLASTSECGVRTRLGHKKPPAVVSIIASVFCNFTFGLVSPQGTSPLIFVPLISVSIVGYVQSESRIVHAMTGITGWFLDATWSPVANSSIARAAQFETFRLAYTGGASASSSAAGRTPRTYMAKPRPPPRSPIMKKTTQRVYAAVWAKMSPEARYQLRQENRESQGRQWDQSRQHRGGRGGRGRGGRAVQE